MRANWWISVPSAERRIVCDDDMPGQLDAVAQRDLVADLAVVRHVRIGHEPVVVADAGHARCCGVVAT